MYEKSALSARFIRESHRGFFPERYLLAFWQKMAVQSSTKGTLEEEYRRMKV
jgi:hypothetical protein